MTERARAALLALVAAGACTRQNQAFCQDDSACGAGARCNRALNRCEPADGGESEAESEAESESESERDAGLDAGTDSGTDAGTDAAPPCPEFGGPCPDLLVDDDGGQCTTPFTDLDAALSAVSSGVIGVCPGTYGPIGIDSGGPTTVIGSTEGMVLILNESNNGIALDVSGGDYTFENVTITGGSGNGHGVQCTGGTLTLREVRIVSSGGHGIYGNAAACTITVERLWVYGNGLDGLRGASNVEVHVVNSFFVSNSGDGVELNPINTATSTFVQNTVVANSGDGVRCNTTFTITNVLADGNGTNNDGCTMVGTCSGPSYADDYHLASGSECIDDGVDSGVGDDYDGDARPFGDAYDVGADEYVE